MASRQIQDVYEVRTYHQADNQDRGLVAPADLVSDTGRLSLGEQLRRPRTLLSFAVSGLIVVYVSSRQELSLAQVWTHTREANLLLLLLGVVSYYVTFYVRALRWQQMLRNSDNGKRSEPSFLSTLELQRIILLSWLANSVLPAKLGDAYRGYLLKQSWQVSFSKIMGMILAERVADVILLCSLLLLSGLLAFRKHLPPNFLSLMVLAASLAVLGLGVLILLRSIGPLVSRILPGKLTRCYPQIEEGALSAFRGRLGWILLLTCIVWILESLRLWFVAASLGTHLGLPLVVFIALTASLLTTVPFTPAGLGIVEGAMISILVWVRVAGIPIDEALAGSIALLDRAITYWGLLLVGTAVYLMSPIKTGSAERMKTVKGRESK